MLFKDIEKLVKLIEDSNFEEFEWEKNKERLRLRKRSSEPGPVSVMYSPSSPSMYAPSHGSHGQLERSEFNSGASALPAAEAPKTKGRDVLSPFVGTFYDAPAPGAASYTDMGKVVQKGEVLCIVEAMKIMNEIEAEFAGKVVSVLAKSGQAVQYGQPLFVIEPL